MLSVFCYAINMYIIASEARRDASLFNIARILSLYIYIYIYKGISGRTRKRNRLNEFSQHKTAYVGLAFTRPIPQHFLVYIHKYICTSYC